MLSVWKIISDCPNQPNLPRQLKTHIAFSMFPILDTNLWGKPTLWTTICSLVAVWESSSKITWSSSGHSCMGVFISVCFLGLQTPKCMGPGCNAECFCFRVIALKEFQCNSCLPVASRSTCYFSENLQKLETITLWTKFIWCFQKTVNIKIAFAFCADYQTFLDYHLLQVQR